MTTTETKPMNFLAMKGRLEKIGKKGSEYIIKWEDISLDFKKNLRDEYGPLSELDSLEFGMIQAIVGYIDHDGMFYPSDGFRRLAWIKNRIDQGLSIPEIKVSLDYDSATTLGRLTLILNSATQKPLTLVEQGKGYLQLKNDCSKTNTEIALIAHKTVAHIGQCMALVSNASDFALEAIEQGHIAASEVQKITSSLPMDEADLLIKTVVDAAVDTGKKVTPKAIKAERAKREPKPKVADIPSQHFEVDEEQEQQSISHSLGNLTSEDWGLMDLGKLRTIMSILYS